MYNKRVLSKIDLGKYSKPNPYSKDIITDPMGQWKYPGVPTRIPSSDITMQGVGYPVLGVADTGQTQMMMPGVDYTFPGANYVDEYPQAKKGGLVKMPKPSKKGLASKKFTSSVMGTSRLFTESPLFAKPKKKKNRIFDPNAKYYQDGGEPGDKFKKRLMKRYPGMQGIYGPEGENLNIVKDPNYDAGSKPYYAGDIEFMFPGLPQVSYKNKDDETLPDYVYKNPSPDKYTSVYNPRGANRADIFLDMLHGMRDDQNYEVLLQNFDKAVRDARGGDMQYYYEQDVANDNYTDGQEQWDDNYVDGQLRAQLAPGTLGMFSHGRRDYRKERRHDSPEMRAAAKDIKNYLKTPKEDYIETELTPEEIEEYRRGGFIVEDISVPQLTMQYGGDPKPKKNKKEVKPLVTSNLKEYAKRKQAYDDSLKLYNASLEEYNLLKKTKGALEDSPFYTKEAYAAYKRLGYPEGYGMTVKRSDNSTVQARFYEKPVQPVYKKSKQQKLVRSSNIKTNNKTKPKEKQYPTSYKPVVNNTPRKLPEGKIQVGEEKVQQLDPNTGQVTTVINPIYEDAMLPMQTLQPRHVDNTLRKFVELPSETSEEKVIEDTEDTIYTEDAGEPGPGGHWEDNTSRYIDWDGNSIGFNGIRFRKPGHGGDLIRKGKRHYIHYPSIEKRYDAWIQPEEYQNGGMILELSDEEISEYQKGGWIVEEL